MQLCTRMFLNMNDINKTFDDLTTPLSAINIYICRVVSRNYILIDLKCHYLVLDNSTFVSHYMMYSGSLQDGVVLEIRKSFE